MLKKTKLLLILILAICSLNTVKCSFNGYLFPNLRASYARKNLVNDASNSNNVFAGSLSQNKKNTENHVENNEGKLEKGCYLDIQSDSNDKHRHEVFSGHGYIYDIGCSVNDPEPQVDDKYYVFDLIVYGPNRRASKAWHEQFMVKSSKVSRNFILDKDLSYNYLGYSSVVCAVKKYNSKTNKFTEICQTNDRVYVKENPIFAKLRSKPPNKKKLFRTSKSTTAPKKIISEIQTVFKPNDIDVTNSNKDILNTNTNILTETQNSESTVTQTSPVKSKENLNVRAMQYRDLYKASSSNDFNSENGLLTEPTQKSKRAILQPIILALVFVFIFCLAIGTIAYMSYNQRLTQEYHTVNLNDGSKNKGDGVLLSKFGKRPKSFAPNADARELEDNNVTVVTV